MRQIIQPFINPEFKEFETKIPKNLYMVGMSQYIEPTPLLHVAFPLRKIDNGLAETVSKSGLKQFHAAETEKFAHVAYFFRGLKETPFNGEDDVLIKSDRVPTENPRMKSDEIASKITEATSSGNYDFILANFANPDMLAHVGNYEETIRGIEAVDENIGKIREAVAAKDGFLIITADHGNTEVMVYKGTGQPETRHNESPVPIYFVASQYAKPQTEEMVAANRREPKGFLSDIAPTVLEILGIQKPAKMTGDSLLTLIN